MFSGPAYASEIKDAAYIVKNINNADSYLIKELKNVGLSAEIISESQIDSVNFSKYRMILIGNQNFDNPGKIPYDEYRTIVINSYNYGVSSDNKDIGWSKNTGLKSSPTSLDILDKESLVVEGLPDSFRAYTMSLPVLTTSYLKGQKAFGAKTIIYSSLKTDSVIGLIEPGAKFLNGKSAKKRNVFFGITNAQYWTQESRKLFNNSVNWILFGEDRDGDGFYSDLDCRDNDPRSYPGAKEIPYDGIDQDCSGADLIDFDEDGFSSSIVGGEDCNDLNININPLNLDKRYNCINDAPVLQEIEEKSYYENDFVQMIISASDPDFEREGLIYSVNDSKFSVFGDIIYWQTGYSDQGTHYVEISVSDGELKDTIILKINVNNVNRAPLFNLIPSIIMNEDSSIKINLSEYFKDEDADRLEYKIEYYPSEDKINSVISDGEILNLVSRDNWYGEDSIVISASDFLDKTLSQRIPISVIPFNDAPEFFREIDNKIINEDSSLENYINLNEYFRDIDSELSFFVVGNSKLKIDINNGLVSILPEKDWYGEEAITFIANDSILSANSNSFYVKIESKDEVPYFNEISCERELEEDKEYECEISASDLENDEIILSVTSAENIYCNILENKLIYLPHEDYNGPANCEISASDKDGSALLDIEFNVLPVDDSPRIFSSSETEEIFINEGDSRIFSVDIKDDDPLMISWLIDGNKVYDGEKYLFSKNKGNYTLTAVYSSNSVVFTKSWNIFIFAKDNLGDNLLKENRNYTFSDAESCKIESKKIILSLGESLSNNDIQPGELLEGDLEIVNNGLEELDLDLEFHLYDLEKDESIEKVKERIKIDSGRRKRVDFEIKIPEYIEADGKYAIYAKAEDGLCSQTYSDISIEDLEHLLKLDLTLPDFALCSNKTDIIVKVKNLGENNEEVNLSLLIPSLNISEIIDSFEIEKLGKRDTLKKTFSLNIPETRYVMHEVTAFAEYNGVNLSVRENLKVDLCEDNYQEAYTEIKDEIVKVNNINDNVFLSSKASYFFSESLIISIILSILNIFFILSIFYMAKWL